VRTQTSRYGMLTDAVESRCHTSFAGHTQERDVRVVAFGIKVAFDAFALVPVRINSLAFGEILDRQKFAGTEVGTVDLTAFINNAEGVTGGNPFVHVHRRAESFFDLG